MINAQIVNEDEDVVSYVNLSDEESFTSLAEFLDGVGYRLEEIGS
jgi:uncharacterized protein with HEPN domain